MHTRLGNQCKRPFISSRFGWRRCLTCRRQLWVFSYIQKGHLITTPMTPRLLVLLNMGLTTPSYGGLELPWRAAWLQQISVDLPRMLRYLEVAYREVFCHHSYGDLLLMI